MRSRNLLAETIYAIETWGAPGLAEFLPTYAEELERGHRENYLLCLDELARLSKPQFLQMMVDMPYWHATLPRKADLLNAVEEAITTAAIYGRIENIHYLMQYAGMLQREPGVAGFLDQSRAHAPTQALAQVFGVVAGNHGGDRFRDTALSVARTLTEYGAALDEVMHRFAKLPGNAAAKKEMAAFCDKLKATS